MNKLIKIGTTIINIENVTDAGIDNSGDVLVYFNVSFGEDMSQACRRFKGDQASTLWAFLTLNAVDIDAKINSFKLLKT